MPSTALRADFRSRRRQTQRSNLPTTVSRGSARFWSIRARADRLLFPATSMATASTILSSQEDRTPNPKSGFDSRQLEMGASSPATPFGFCRRHTTFERSRFEGPPASRTAFVRPAVRFPADSSKTFPIKTSCWEDATRYQRRSSSTFLDCWKDSSLRKRSTAPSLHWTLKFRSTSGNSLMRCKWQAIRSTSLRPRLRPARSCGRPMERLPEHRSCKTSSPVPTVHFHST